MALQNFFFVPLSLSRVRPLLGFGMTALLAALAVGFFPQKLYATQVHSEPEGLYAHQLGHLFFIISMGVFIYWLRGRRLIRHKGWRYLQYSALLFILWNADAALVHHLENQNDIFQKFSEGTLHAYLQPYAGREWLTWIFFLVKLDHLLCVPAIIFLYLALREVQRSPFRFSPQDDTGS
ncbi:hypothetical protein EDC27_2633 [Desulfosoma caldarium]|uniref:Uncharacterized protein n=2 Tax=Desulfosoma caldarium TaxID=610254 RepID=A0A3N1UKT0_9BACT|nr:hypothetical protein EDC27_2633 [Desulfosoma caldarium]